MKPHEFRAKRTLQRKFSATDGYTLPNDPDLAAQYLLLYELPLPVGRDLNNLIDVERSATRVTVLLGSLSTNENIGVDDRAQTWLREYAPDLETKATGVAVVGAHSIQRNIEKMLLETVIAMAVVSLLLVFVFRSLRLGLISLMPNFVPAAMAMGLWGYAVGEIGVAAAVVTAIAFGIIVDDTIHFMTKYIGARKRGLLPSEAVQATFPTVGKALLATTVVFAMGFLVFGASGMTNNQAHGVLVGITMVVALLADFFFLPPLLMVLDGIKTTSKGAGERLKGVESRTGAPTLGSGGNVRRFRFGPQSGSHSHVSSSRSSNRPCGFPATGSRTRSCLRPRKAGRSRGKVNEVVVLP